MFDSKFQLKDKWRRDSNGSRRLQRVEKEVWEVISTYLAQQQSGSSERLVTLSQISVSGDLRRVRAYVCVIGTGEMDSETLEILSSHSSQIQTRISDRLRMKYCPKVEFYAHPSSGFIVHSGENV